VFLIQTVQKRKAILKEDFLEEDFLIAVAMIWISGLSFI
jgi:hypothetical protein